MRGLARGVVRTNGQFVRLTLARGKAENAQKWLPMAAANRSY